MTVLVTGGNGKTSSRLATLLKQDNIPVLVASRSGSSAGAANSCRFDWTDESTYGNPFEAASDISSLYIVAPEGFDLLKATNPFIDYALKNGVKRLVFLSASSIECGEPVHGKVHEYIKSLGVEYGILRRKCSHIAQHVRSLIFEPYSNMVHAELFRGRISCTYSR